MPEKRIIARLESFAGLTALVGSGGAARIYPQGNVPQGPTKPYVVYTVVSRTPASQIGGSSGLAESLIQFTARGANYGSAVEVAEQIRLALQGYSDDSGTPSIRAVYMRNSRDEPTGPTDGGERLVAGRQIDFNVWHTETIPS